MNGGFWPKFFMSVNMNLARFVVSIHDISEKKQREKDLQETKEYLANLIQYANAPSFYLVTRF